MKICTICGYQNSDKANFCVKCGTSLKNKKDKFKKTLIAIAAAAALLVILAFCFGPKWIPFSSVPKNVIIVNHYLENKYPEDNLKIKFFEGSYDDYEVIEQWIGYTDTWVCTFTSDEFEDERFEVSIHTDGEIMGDNYWCYKYHSEMTDILEDTLDDCFGAGNYTYDQDNIFSFLQLNNSEEDLGAQGYLANNAICLAKFIVSSDFDSTDEEKICNNIMAALGAHLGSVADLHCGMTVYFDKADEIAAPEEYYAQYIALNYWEKRLQIYITNGELRYEVEYNTEPNKTFQTKTPFLNGKNPVLTIDDYSFTLGDTTPNDIVKNTRFNSADFYKKMEYNQKFGGVHLRDEYNKNRIDLGVINDSHDALKFDQCKIHQICLGDYSDDSIYDFSDCSIDGLYIGEVVDEQTLIEHFGMYEEKKESQTGSVTYRFIDGTASVYDNQNLEPNKYLVILLTEDREISVIEYGFNGTDLDVNKAETFTG